WDAAFAADTESQTKQYDLLDALATVTPTPVPADADTAGIPAVKFRYTVAVADKATTDRIAAKFEAVTSPSHPSARPKVKTLSALPHDAAHPAAFERRAAEIRTVQEMWHGSRAWNILNILRTGLHIPTSSTPASPSGMDFHGALF